MENNDKKRSLESTEEESNKKREIERLARKISHLGYDTSSLIIDLCSSCREAKVVGTVIGALKKNGQDLDKEISADSHTNPAHCAAGNGNLVVLEALCAEGIPIRASVLYWALRSENLATIRWILDKTNVPAYSTPNDPISGYYSIVTAAVGMRDHTLIMELLSRSADPNHCSEYCSHPLSVAVMNDDVEMVKLLLQNGSQWYKNISDFFLLFAKRKAWWDNTLLVMQPEKLFHLCMRKVADPAKAKAALGK